MRIAIVNWTYKKVGGAETYLNTIIPEFLRLGNDVAFWYEKNEPLERHPIAPDEEIPAWCASTLGFEQSLAELKKWQPDLLYTHVVLNRESEAETLKIAPAVFFAHAYYGTCISGSKTFKMPVTMPCDRRFGWQCLLYYFPRHCGGWSPVTALRRYSEQTEILSLKSKYKAIVTHSAHMRSEYLNHGFAPDRVHSLPFCIDNSSGETDQTGGVGYESNREGAYRLLFAGRMDFLKGGHTFLDALTLVKASLNRPLQITFIGDGPERNRLEHKAALLESRAEGLNIAFKGWVNGPRLDSFFLESDLLVVPSLWPEPFGLVGPEAGIHGLPAVAFDVGGISDWLTDGVNGHLAAGDPPTAAGLARAILKCLHDSAHYARLREGARKLALRFSVEKHINALMPILEAATIHKQQKASI